MKFRIIISLLLCFILAGCTNAPNQQKLSTETVRPETTEKVTTATVICPLPDTTMESMDNSIVHISIGQGDFSRDKSGNICLRMQVYSYDKFDMVDISSLKAGDTIILSGEEIAVNTV